MDKEQFRIELVKYLAENWEKEIDVKSVSAEYGYSQRYFTRLFKESFGFPFTQFLMKLRLQRAALMISKKQNLMNIGRFVGYANAQSFSKAFRKEWGLSPKQFLDSEKEVPDMPVNCEINGEPVKIIYSMTQEKLIQGEISEWIVQEGQSVFELADQCNDYFVNKSREFLPEQEQMEIWWKNENGSICRMNGLVLDKNAAASAEGKTITVYPDYYAQFQVKVRTNGDGISSDRVSEVAKKLVRHAMKEWAVINEKDVRQMGYLLISYQDEQVRLYLPVHKRSMIGEEKAPKFKGAADWIRYIDDHIRKNLTVTMLAEEFHYSERHFTDTFEMYFGIRPGLYIKKRRLYLVAKELKQGAENIENLVFSYGFSSIASFKKDFHEVFHCNPEEYEEEFKAENLNLYYDQCRQKFRISFVEEQQRMIEGRNVSSNRGQNEVYGDLIESIVWYLQSDCFDKGKEALEDEKIVIWQTAKDRREHYCLVGRKIEDRNEDEQGNHDTYSKVNVSGGTYAVMETVKTSDKDTLSETYRMLYRCAFGNWIRENQEKIDLARLTFVKYRGEKLYFYIPIYA